MADAPMADVRVYGVVYLARVAHGRGAPYGSQLATLWLSVYSMYSLYRSELGTLLSLPAGCPLSVRTDCDSRSL